MSQIGVDLRSWLLSIPAVNAATGGQRVHQNQVPQDQPPLYVWYARRSVDQDLFAELNDGGTDPAVVSWDIEVIGDNIDDVKTVATAIMKKNRTFGASPMSAASRSISARSRHGSTNCSNRWTT